MNKSNAMKELQRLKDVNISLENNIKETKEQTNKDSSENTEDYEQISIFDDLD